MSRLSRRERDKEARWLLQGRDLEILRALRTVRYMTTSQARRAFFPSSKDEQTARRRLRALFDLGLTARTVRLVPAGEGSPEEVHYLDDGGIEFLRGEGMDAVELDSEGRRPRFLEHALAVSEIWVCLHLALTPDLPVSLELFVADFELRARQRQGDRTYRLTADQRLVEPDAVVILRGAGEFASFRRLLFFEADRGSDSEALRVIEEKVIAYARLRQEGSYRTLGENLQGYRVLIATTSEERARNIRRRIRGKPGDELVWVTGERLSERSILRGSIWLDNLGERRTLLKTGADA